MEWEELLTRHLGQLGRFQLFVVVCLLTVRFPSVIHNMGYVFYAATPPHWCEYPRYNVTAGMTEVDRKLLYIPSRVEAGDREFSRCKIYRWAEIQNATLGQVQATLEAIMNGTEFGQESQMTCASWEYDRVSGVKNSLVTEHNMVCDRAWMKSMVATVFVLGWMASSPVAGYFSDRLGRRKVITAASIGTVASGLALPFVTNYVAFLVVRFFVSFFMNGALSICFTACMEWVGPRYRSCIANVYMTVWAVFYMALAGFAAILRDRFNFMIAMAAPTVLILVAVVFVPESVPWLAAKGHKEAANQIVRRIAKSNKRHLPEGIQVTVEERKEKAKTHFLDLVRTSNIRMISLILFLNWLVDGMVFYAISWNSTDLSGNIYLNTFLAGAVELPAYILNIPLLQTLGRKLSMSVCTTLSGVFLLCTLAVPNAKGAAMVGLTITSKFFITMAFSTVWQYTTELYPTVTRTIGLTTCNFMCRVGTLVAPYLPLLGRQLPQILCGSLAVLASISLLFLPETLNQPLASSIEEAETHHKVSLRNISKGPWSGQKSISAVLPEKSIGLGPPPEDAQQNGMK